METLFAWQNLIFNIPLMIGILLALGLALGFGHEAEHDLSHDIQHDVHHDTDGNHEHEQGALNRAFMLFGVGKIPITVLLMIAALIFGVTGTVANRLLAPILRFPAAYGWISLIASFVAMTFLTGKIAKLFHRVVPTLETSALSKRAIIGCTGTLVVAASATSGVIQVYDKQRDLKQVDCRTDGEELPRGSEAIIIDYREGDDTYLIEAYNHNQ